MPSHLALALALALSAPIAAAATPGQEPAREQDPPRQPDGAKPDAKPGPKPDAGAVPAKFSPGAVARAPEVGELTGEELDEILLWRHALTQPGRAALRQLLEVRVLDALGKERGIEVTAADVNARFAELDAEAIRAGQKGGLEQFIQESGVPRAMFREFLRLAIVHERLTRAALGLAKDEAVSTEQQETWLAGELERRKYEEEPFPWRGGVVARSNEVTVTRDDFVAHMRGQIERSELAETCYLALLERAARQAMPDLSEEGIDKALDVELARRREEAEADPRYHGVGYEQLLEAKGLSIDALRRDPAIRSAALAHVWVDRTSDDAALRKVYEDERAFFDALFGAGVEVRAIMLSAIDRPNELITRTFEEADARLLELRRQIESPDDFARIASQASEDRATRDRGGMLGVVTSGSFNVPPKMRAAITEFLDATPGDVAGKMLGPVRIDGGSVLMMLGARRPAPTWEAMREHVHRELRRRFLDDALSRDEVETVFD